MQAARCPRRARLTLIKRCSLVSYRFGVCGRARSYFLEASSNRRPIGISVTPSSLSSRRSVWFCRLRFLVGAALIIWVESSGPILYRQERVGERGKLFTLFKLRTMQHDAEKETGAVWAAADGDPRATFFGRFLRISRIDELPQLFNVVKGEMSFVGPRPERPEFVEQLQALIPYYQERHSVKPGITGWAQVRHGYGGSVEEAETKLRFDLYYIKHMSVWLDLRILLEHGEGHAPRSRRQVTPWWSASTDGSRSQSVVSP